MPEYSEEEAFLLKAEADIKFLCEVYDGLGAVRSRVLEQLMELVGMLAEERKRLSVDPGDCDA